MTSFIGVCTLKRGDTLMFITIPLRALDQQVAKLVGKQIASYAVQLKRQEFEAFEAGDFSGSFEKWTQRQECGQTISHIAKWCGESAMHYDV